MRRTYGIFALPAQVLFDRSDDLLNPTRGYRLKLNVSPETSVQGGVSPYARTMVEATGYYHVNDSLVIAGRARAGSILGIARDDIAPSRRYYGGGGGSVRGYGYQRLGPFEPVSSLVPDEDGNIDLNDLRPVGGRSINEFAIEARYRFGDFGIVPFFDAGNAYESSFPKGGDLRYGAGIGGRFYTNFGPMRVDVATPAEPATGRRQDRALHLDRAGILMAEHSMPADETIVLERRPLWQRIVKWVGIVIAAIVLLLIAVVLGINTDPGRRFVADQIGGYNYPHRG